MSGKWKLNKVENFGPLRASFWTLYEDMRDEMSDSVRPSWGISEDTEHNRKVTVEMGVSTVVFSVICSRERGNEIYGKLWTSYRIGGFLAVEKWINAEKARIRAALA